MRPNITAFLLFLTLTLGSVFSQTGAANPTTRFVDNGDGTMTDTSSGLMWQMSLSVEVFNWADAVRYADDLTFAGYTDWRLAYRVELTSLYPAGMTDFVGWLRDQGFENVQSAEYWTGTWFDYLGADYAWVVNLRHGSMRSSPQENAYHVWVLRGGK